MEVDLLVSCNILHSRKKKKSPTCLVVSSVSFREGDCEGDCEGYEESDPAEREWEWLVLMSSGRPMSVRNCDRTR